MILPINIPNIQVIQRIKSLKAAPLILNWLDTTNNPYAAYEI